MAGTKKTRLERYITYWHNHRFVSLVIPVGLVVTGIASLTDAVSKIADLGGRLLGRSHSKPDQWTTVLRVTNRGSETISIEKLCELHYEVAEAVRIVAIVAVGHKEHNPLIRGKEVKL